MIAIPDAIITGPTSLVRHKSLRKNNLSASVRSDRWFINTYLLRGEKFRNFNIMQLLLEEF